MGKLYTALTGVTSVMYTEVTLTNLYRIVQTVSTMLFANSKPDDEGEFAQSQFVAVAQQPFGGAA